MEQNHRMELQYDGTGLHGWAKQEGLPTVEGSLEAAFRTVLGAAPTLRVAGRTDAGVHARRQVVSLRLPADTELGRLTRSLNALTPAGIAVTRLVRAREGFDARRDATSRIYRYFISTGAVPSPFWQRYSWRRPGLDTAMLELTAAATVGRHDFTAFTPNETEHVFFDRLVLRCAWKRMRGAVGDAPGGVIFLEIEAEAFLRHMVRGVVGTMVEVAEGTRDLDAYESLLAGAGRWSAGPTAPARGLFLWDVKYQKRARAAERHGR